MRKQAIIQVSHIINIPEDMQDLDDERLLDEIDEFAIDLLADDEFDYRIDDIYLLPD